MADYTETSSALRDELLNTIKERRSLNKDKQGVDALSPEELETLARAFAAIHGNTK